MKVIQLSYSSHTLSGTIQLPASKSISNRALILKAVTGNSIELLNLSTADDTILMQSVLNSDQHLFDLKNAGTCMRFLTAYFAASPHRDVTLLCSERMEQRPINELVTALRTLGADIEYLKKEGFPPLRIKGKKLSGGSVKIVASQSSQFASALMMIAPLFETNLTIELTGDITSMPYLEMTAKMMQQLGIEIVQENSKFEIRNSKKSQFSNHTPIAIGAQFIIEPDWSAASYWYEMVALSQTAEIFLPGLSLNSIQGDAMIADYMKLFGVCTTQTETGIVITKLPITQHKQQTINLQHQPDLAPALAVAAAATGTPLILTGLQNLAIKESNRLLALQTELIKLGFNIETTGDSLEIIPHTESPSNPFEPVQTYNDHRMAMAFAPLALIRPLITLEHPEVVEKSYPHFWEDLHQVGFGIHSFES